MHSFGAKGCAGMAHSACIDAAIRGIFGKTNPFYADFDGFKAIQWRDLVRKGCELLVNFRL